MVTCWVEIFAIPLTRSGGDVLTDTAVLGMEVVFLLLRVYVPIENTDMNSLEGPHKTKHRTTTGPSNPTNQSGQNFP